MSNKETTSVTTTLFAIGRVEKNCYLVHSLWYNMNEQGRYIVSIKTSDSVAFDRLSSKYHIDLFHNAAFDEQKKQFTVD